MPTTIHILYVGRGDSIIVESNLGNLAMIDSHRSATTDPFEYLKSNFPDKELSLFVLSHPHHHRLAGLQQLRRDIGFKEFWDTEHTLTAETITGNVNSAKKDWDEYFKIRQGGFPDIKVSRRLRGEKISLSETEVIEVLSPTKELEEKALETGDLHYSSYVLKVKCLDNQAILGGSANAEVWEDIYNAYGDSLKSSLLVASHHGHRDSFFKPAIKAIHPEFVVVSSEEEKYADAAGLYGRYCNGVISTAFLGDVVARCFPSGGIELSTQY